MIDCQDTLSVRHPCRVLGLDRSGIYYEPVGPDAAELALGHRLDERYTAHPHYGVRLMTQTLRREPIQQRHQIREPTPQPHPGDVSGPHLMRACNRPFFRLHNG